MYGKNAVFLLNVRKFQQQEPLEGGLRPICYEQWEKKQRKSSLKAGILGLRYSLFKSGQAMSCIAYIYMLANIAYISKIKKKLKITLSISFLA